MNAIRQRLGSGGEFFAAIDACYSRGMERGEETDIDDTDILSSARGTADMFSPGMRTSYLRGVPRPRPFAPGATLYVVSACKETERNYEYKTPAGKMYGSLSYYIYTLLKTDAHFARWAQCFKNDDYRCYRIFQPSQHPTIMIYP